MATDPGRNIRFNIANSPGGLIDEGMGIFDIMRLINILPGCGSVLTSGKGRIEGISALLLAGGKYGERKIHNRGRIVLKDVEEVSAAGTPASEVLSIGREARRAAKRLVDRFDRHSKLSRPVIEEKIAEGQEKKEEGFKMDALEAVEHEFVDRIS
jgi:ATP-dependent protease ClpP protease subunit